MNENEKTMTPQAEELFRKKFEAYKEVLDKDGPEAAWNALMDGYHVGKFFEAFQAHLDRPEVFL